jgi:hypothetical protein
VPCSPPVRTDTSGNPPSRTEGVTLPGRGASQQGWRTQPHRHGQSGVRPTARAPTSSPQVHRPAGIRPVQGRKYRLGVAPQQCDRGVARLV